VASLDALLKFRRAAVRRIVRGSRFALLSLAGLAAIPGTSRATPLFSAPLLSFETGRNPVSVVIVELNGDGKPDLAAVNLFSNTVSVLLGHGDGTFGAKTDYATGLYPLSLALGDLNGDSKLDLAVANEGAATVSVLLGNGDGTFGAKSDFATGSVPARWRSGT
jgi:VCBS repeat protein